MKFLSLASPFLNLKKCDIFTKIHQKRPLQIPAVARLRDPFGPTSRKYVSAEPKIRSFQ